MLRKFFTVDSGALAEKRQVRVVISSENEDRFGDIVKQDGIDFSAFQKNPIVLWQHNPSQPIARCTEIGIQDGKLVALAQFPPEGTSDTSDQVYRLIKERIVNSASIGFMPLDSEPMDPKQPWGAQTFLKSELFEFSFVSIPANTDADIIGRAHKASEWKCGASRTLPVDSSEQWDDLAAAESVFAACGFDGDKPDVKKARKAFLLYDAANPELKSSYKMPVARMVDGRMMLSLAAVALIDKAVELPEEVKALIASYAPEQVVEVKAGARLSAATTKCLKDALDMHDEAMDLHSKAIKAGNKAIEQHTAAMEAHTKAFGMIKDLLNGTDPADDEEGPENNDDGKAIAAAFAKAQRVRQAEALRLTAA